MSLATATKSVPFSNGTEGEAWMSKWCDYCEHDHGIHEPEERGPGCDLILFAMMGDLGPGEPWTWPEAWLPEPDDGSFSLPSRMVCGMFKPCHLPGCNGDPAPDARAERVEEVTVYWRTRR